MKSITHKIILSLLTTIVLIGCKNDSNELINYCYQVDENGEIIDVICDNISKEECNNMNSSNSATWVFDIDQACPIRDPEIPNN